MKMKEYSSSIALWFGGVTAGIGVLTLSDWAMITGIICTLGTFALNWYYKQKELQLRMGVGNVTSPEK
ncbi:phage holin family protein [Yersinia enterocolitica]|uniref:phage holin family protein n=1 Tax=Yersinia enterocolitica TaxID=630 RepID=UPI00067B1C33|nr:phage holin family protein [Yersinia enterocolitica]EKN3612477.1 phage holin family protein [Yersinia enterocolitica]